MAPTGARFDLSVTISDDNPGVPLVVSSLASALEKAFHAALGDVLDDHGLQEWSITCQRTLLK